MFRVLGRLKISRMLFSSLVVRHWSFVESFFLVVFLCVLRTTFAIFVVKSFERS
jgi:hypothetical protein